MGVVPTINWLLVLGIASVLALVFGIIFEPLFAIMQLGDVRNILLLFFPKGLLLAIFLITAAAYLIENQKIKRKGGL